MNSFMLVLAVLFCTSTFSQFIPFPKEADASQKLAFNRFIEVYKKEYANKVIENERWSIFKENLARVEMVRKQNPNAQFGITQFMDMTAKEFAKKQTGCFGNLPMPESSKDTEVVFKTAPNGSVDWVEQGAVTDVKNQGSCGSCWSFSTTGALEGAYYLKHNELISLSEQQLVSCSNMNHGCRGGSMNLAFVYTQSHPLEAESDYPYTSGTSGKDGMCEYVANEGVVGASGYKTVTPNSVDALKSALDLGPVSVAIEADKPAFQFYQGGVIESNCGQQLDHGVLAVGYTDGYFKVKNSWGNKWGEEGYVRISDSAKNVCGILSMASYPTMD